MTTIYRTIGFAFLVSSTLLMGGCKATQKNCDPIKQLTPAELQRLSKQKQKEAEQLMRDCAKLEEA